MYVCVCHYRAVQPAWIHKQYILDPDQNLFTKGNHMKYKS